MINKWFQSVKRASKFASKRDNVATPRGNQSLEEKAMSIMSYTTRALFVGGLALAVAAPSAVWAAGPGCTGAQKTDQEQLGQNVGQAQKADQEQLGQNVGQAQKADQEQLGQNTGKAQKADQEQLGQNVGKAQKADQEQLGQNVGHAQKADQEQLGAHGNAQFAMNTAGKC